MTSSAPASRSAEELERIRDAGATNRADRTTRILPLVDRKCDRPNTTPMDAPDGTQTVAPSAHSDFAVAMVSTRSSKVFSDSKLACILPPRRALAHRAEEQQAGGYDPYCPAQQVEGPITCRWSSQPPAAGDMSGMMKKLRPD